MLIHIRSIHYKLIRQESCPSKWIRCLQFFSLFNCPLTPWVRDLWVEGLVGWQFNSAFWGIPLALTGRIEVIKWRRTRGAYRMAAHLDRSIPSSSMPFSLYINQVLFLSFLYFLPKFTISANPSSLLKKHSVHLVQPSFSFFSLLTSNW